MELNLINFVLFELLVNYFNVKAGFSYFISLLVFSSALLLQSCGGEKSPEGASPAPQGPRTTQVRGVEVRVMEVGNEIITPGTFEAWEQVNITPELAGIIQSIHFNEGATVRKGQLLVAMDARELTGQIRKLELEIELAADERRRVESLFEIQAVSEEELIRIRNRESVMTAEKELLEIRKSKLNIYAPFAGQIGLRQISEGNYVSPGSRIATLHQTRPLKLDFDVPELYIHQIGVGTNVKFTTVGSAEKHSAAIYAIEPGINPQSRTMRVRARVENSDGLFLPGRFAQVVLLVDVNPEAVMVPAEAVIPVIEGQIIFVSRNGIAESIRINTGIRTENFVEIKEGLSKGDTVITTGLMALADGARLKVELVDFSHNN